MICHNGLEKAPEHLMAAVKNLGQCINVRSSKSLWWNEGSLRVVNIKAFLEYNECILEPRGG